MDKNHVKICFGILMDSFILWYRVKTTSREDQTVKCAEFSVKNKLAQDASYQLFENMFVQVVLSLLASVKPIFSVNKHFVPLPLNQYYT